jgi:hypothetical protein
MRESADLYCSVHQLFGSEMLLQSVQGQTAGKEQDSPHVHTCAVVLTPGPHHAALVLVLVSSANALACHLLHLTLIHMTSSVTTSVVGELRTVLILLLSAVWLGESITIT